MIIDNVSQSSDSAKPVACSPPQVSSPAGVEGGAPMKRPGLAFSHVGIYVNDLPQMEEFYTRLLEFTVTDRGALPGPAGPVSLVFLSRDPDEHHQIVLASGRPERVDFNVINRVPVDFGLDDAALMTTLEQHARTLAGFMSRAQWRAQTARRMGVA